MASPELVTYISQQTQQGVSAQVLRETLLESGWGDSDIENAFHDVAAGLDPLSTGVSLHEDVSQVRSMVTHLASRIKNLEATLVSAGVLPMQAELPAGAGDPSRTLSAKNPTSSIVGILLSAGAISLLMSWLAMTVFVHQSLMPTDAAVIASGIATIFLAIGLVSMHFRHAWTAAIWVAASVIIWGAVVWTAWREHQAIEWTTALALGVLLLVLTVVIGRRIDRR